MAKAKPVIYLQCPRCGEISLHPEQVLNALSRRDNETYICSACGTDEAMWDLMFERWDAETPTKENRIRLARLQLARERESSWLEERKPLNEIIGRPWPFLMKPTEKVAE